MDTLDLQEAAELLKVSDETVREMARSGTILGAKVGVAWVFIKDDLMEFLRRETRRQTNERRAAVEADAVLIKNNRHKPHVETAFSRSGKGRREKRSLPNLDAVEAAAAQ
ncbi:helix-turn-helix domain-containing protein [Laribacter hongkongensis]|uniref:Helix-turn-helix domain-containing protein n=1 Tax=Laribacter hongkongensis (strain HLHK9) TaxID=557598 RepID=C1DCI6_LARHH|nr:helix-turn-helix domain-containing protein [Laribacter hongkongensis]ACO75605.1 hypothetical protein LHK_02624 [Laribacter hongkongensis HLHK9]MCG8995031.1 helix-turn-helix domain-containing protein [Laribacter hongkongensis]MCG9011142.1 helix-turn-helix domain-containing protein [Laribacter hongkongensis]MCG9023541.1 helix-turn-helix domain-containing protein [Laribacter hongkongensis]MCG9031391.1 helix-turn-helix domain-containing protein [Laribacter hongkongensis]